jgi:hypothetical protein
VLVCPSVVFLFSSDLNITVMSVHLNYHHANMHHFIFQPFQQFHTEAVSQCGKKRPDNAQNITVFDVYLQQGNIYGCKNSTKGLTK